MGTVTIRRDNPNALNDLAKTLQPGVVRIGWFPSARYDDEKNTPVAAIAAQNEYGNPSKNIPARPFIRPAIAHNQNKWSDIGRRGLKAVLAKKSTVLAVLQNTRLIKYSRPHLRPLRLRRVCIDVNLRVNLASYNLKRFLSR